MDPHARDSVPSIRPLRSVSAEPLLTRDFDARPALVYERLRHRYGPVAPVDVLGVPVWLALGYSEVLEVLRNERGIWSKRPDDWRDRVEGRLPAGWPLLPQYELDAMPMKEGRRLAELRGAWTAALRPFQDRSRAEARKLENGVHRTADELISIIGESGRTGLADLSAQYVRPLVLTVCNRLIGFTVGTDEIMMDMWRLVDAGPEAAEAMHRVLDALARAVTSKRLDPGDDLPSYMMIARPDLTDDTITREMLVLIGTAGELTSSLICNTVVEVITGNAGARASLAAGMIRETVNRVAMARPPLANTTFRFATADTVLGGTAIAAGDPVMLSLAAAHADPRFVEAVDHTSVHSSRAHLAWSAGPHQCPADDLATSIVTIAVERLFERFDELELALPADQLPWRSSPLIRGLRSLPVRFHLADWPVRPDSGDREPAAAGSGDGGAKTTENAAPRSQSSLARLARALLRQRA